MEDVERIRERRDNVEAIEPVVTSMRTISAGGWRQALSRMEASRSYCNYMEHVLALAIARLPRRALASLDIAPATIPARRPLMLVISSERGLCGAYNDTVVRGADQIITSQSVQSDVVRVSTLGARAGAQLRRMGRVIDHEWALPTSRVADMALVNAVASDLRSELADDACDALYIVYSPYRADAVALPIAERWLPVDMGMLPRMASNLSDVFSEGDPEELVRQALEGWTTGRLFRMVMDAAASEQAARYRAMETASGNLQRMTEDLTLQYHSARQHAITMEMLDLASGAEGSRPRPDDTGA